MQDTSQIPGADGALFFELTEKLHALYPASRVKAERAAKLALETMMAHYAKLMEGEE